MSARMINCFNELHHLSEAIGERRYENLRNRLYLSANVDKHIKATIAMLEMFEGELSKRKINLLRKYRDLRKETEEKEENKSSISELSNKPKRISAIKEGDL
jgi:hypothetical protein